MNVDVAPDSHPAQWHCTSSLNTSELHAIRRQLELEGCKWDTQVGDTTTLAPFALVLPTDEWRTLAQHAESLAAELVTAEQELMQRPDLWPTLGLPARVRRALETTEPWTPSAARAIRFDFHPTDDGWRISEANGDVPGGFIEGSDFASLVAQHISGTRLAGDPTQAFCDALAGPKGSRRRIALLAAPGYPSDLQVTAHLAQALRGRGCETFCARPEQLQWRDGVAHIRHGPPLDAIYRFYQGEWMTRQRHNDWRFLFRGGLTPVCNPAVAVLTESKRLPLLWPRLDTAMPTWRRLLPDTRSPLALLRQPRRDWVLKAAYSNNGDMTFARSWSRRRDYLTARAHALIAPRSWIAQSRFRCLPVATPLGPVHPCVGVFTVNGTAAGLYGRLSPRPLIDFAAIDVAVLIPD